MALSTQDRERIREEEWVRAQAREDFEHLSKAPLHENRLVGVAGMFALVFAVMTLMVLFIRFMGAEGL